MAMRSEFQKPKVPLQEEYPEEEVYMGALAEYNKIQAEFLSGVLAQLERGTGD